LQIGSTLLALLRLGIALVTIAVIAALLLAFAAGLILALEEVLLAPTLRERIPGTQLLRAVTGKEASSLTLGLALSFLAYGALSVAVLIEARRRGRSEWRSLVAWHPWNPGRTDRGVYLVAAAALAYGFLADLALRNFRPPTDPWLTLPADPAAALVLALVAVVCAPVAEELLFRGWIYSDLRRHLGFVTTLVVTSAVFAWLHYESTHLYALAVFPIGLALGAMREITGSVKPPIAFHAFNNFLAVGLVYLGF
jgi:membrane protease YdiL (CAAX protease family)